MAYPTIVLQTNDLINAISRLAAEIDAEYSDACLDCVMTQEAPTTIPQRIVFELHALGFILNASGLADPDEAAVVRFVDYHNA